VVNFNTTRGLVIYGLTSGEVRRFIPLDKTVGARTTMVKIAPKTFAFGIGEEFDFNLRYQINSDFYQGHTTRVYFADDIETSGMQP